MQCLLGLVLPMLVLAQLEGRSLKQQQQGAQGERQPGTGQSHLSRRRSRQLSGTLGHHASGSSTRPVRLREGGGGGSGGNTEECGLPWCKRVNRALLKALAPVLEVSGPGLPALGTRVALVAAALWAAICTLG